MKIVLDRYGREKLLYDDELSHENSTKFVRLAAIVQDSLDRMVMQSDLRDIYHGVTIGGFERAPGEEKVVVNKFNLQVRNGRFLHTRDVTVLKSDVN